MAVSGNPHGFGLRPSSTGRIRRGLTIALLGASLSGLTGCGWVSNQWSGLFGSGGDKGLAAAPEAERHHNEDRPSLAASMKPVLSEPMENTSHAMADSHGASEPGAKSSMAMEGPKPASETMAQTQPMMMDEPVMNPASMSDLELRQRVASLDNQLRAIRGELSAVRPPIDRLVQMEGDIRQLVQRLSPPNPTTAQAAKPAEKMAKPAQPPKPAPVPPEQMPQPGTDAYALMQMQGGVPAKTSALAPAPAPAPAASAQANGADPLFADTQQYAIHLASYRSEMRAALGWKEYRAKFKPLIDTLQPRVLGIDFNDGRGMFYRLKGGPFPNKAEAQKVCDEIKSRGEFCKVEEFTGTPLAQATASR